MGLGKQQMLLGGWVGGGNHVSCQPRVKRFKVIVILPSCPEWRFSPRPPWRSITSASVITHLVWTLSVSCCFISLPHPPSGRESSGTVCLHFSLSALSTPSYHSLILILLEVCVYSTFNICCLCLGQITPNKLKWRHGNSSHFIWTTWMLVGLLMTFFNYLITSVFLRGKKVRKKIKRLTSSPRQLLNFINSHGIMWNHHMQCVCMYKNGFLICTLFINIYPVTQL